MKAFKQHLFTPLNIPVQEPKKEYRFSPLVFFGVLVVSIFLVEISIMGLLQILPDLPDFYDVLLDGSLLTIVTLPILIYFYLRPMMAQIERQQEADRRFKAVFEQTFQFMCILNPDGTILEANDSAILTVAQGQEAVQGQFFWDAFGSILPAQTKISLQQAVLAASQGNLIRFEEKFGAQANDFFVVDISVKPLLNENDQIKLIILEGRDITHLKQIEQNLRTEIAIRQEKELQIQKSAQQAIALTEITSALQEVKDSYQPFLEVAAQKTAELLGDGCLFYVLTENKTSIETIALHHTDPHACRQLTAITQSDTGLPNAPLITRMTTAKTAVIPLASELDQIQHSLPEGYQAFFDQFGLTNFIAVPLQIQNRLIGGLLLFRNKIDVPYTRKEIDIAQDIALKAGLAVNNGRLFQAEQHARQTRETLSTAALALTRTLKLEYIFDQLLNYLEMLIPFDAGCITLLENETKLAVRATRGLGQTNLPDQYFEEVLANHANSFIEKSLTTQSSYLIPDTQHDREWTTNSPAMPPQMVTWLVVPIVTGNKVIGLCLLAAAQANRFSQEHQQISEAMLSQAAVAIQNAWLFEQIRVGRERLQSLSRRLVDIQEAERRYIARELHDEVGQALTSLMVGMRLIERDAEQPDRVLGGISKLKQMVDEVLENLHRLAVHLRPASLDHLGLIPALQQYIDDLNERGDLSIQFETMGVDMRVESEVETVLYRIVQEALTNVFKHAQATRVDVLIERREEKLVTIIEDDGVGFDTSQPVSENHLGLFGIRERLDMFGGMLHLESAPGIGTTLFVEVPYEN